MCILFSFLLFPLIFSILALFEGHLPAQMLAVSALGVHPLSILRVLCGQRHGRRLVCVTCRHLAAML